MIHAPMCFETDTAYVMQMERRDIGSRSVFMAIEKDAHQYIQFNRSSLWWREAPDVDGLKVHILPEEFIEKFKEAAPKNDNYFTDNMDQICGWIRAGVAV